MGMPHEYQNRPPLPKTFSLAEPSYPDIEISDIHGVAVTAVSILRDAGLIS
jgi:hypothetical protein